MTLDDVDWPTTWRAVPLWSLFSRVKDVEHPDEEMLSVYREHGVVKKETRDDNFNKTAEDRSIYQLVDKGWLVVNRMKAWQGSLGVSPYRGIVSGHYICFAPRHAEDPRFLNHLLRSDLYRTEFARLSRGVRPNQLEIDNDLLRLLPVHLPDVETQRLIAGFLDSETSRLDDLTSARRRQRIALIERRDAEARRLLAGGESGQPLPLAPLKRRWRVIDCKHRTAEYTLTGYPVVSPGDVTPGVLDLSRCHRFVSEKDFRDLTEGRRPRLGDLIYSRNASIGIAAYVAADAPFTMGQDVCLITSKDQDQRYLGHVLNTLGVDQLEQLKIGSTFSRVNVSHIQELLIPDRETPEQRTVADELEYRSALYNDALTQLDRAIDLLRERKQALITAAVTGQVGLAREIAEEAS